ncbi:MAG: HAMP domain-containing histidine kinase [Micrococcales bacterium]|nr:HAMP domain-containing histidine kinase [Micrococcales bacterium]
MPLDTREPVSVHRSLRRSTLTAVGAALTVFGLPASALAVWLAGGGEAASDALRRLLPGQYVVPALLAGLLMLAAGALAIGRRIASRQAVRFTTPMTQLAERAERLGAGESRFQPLDSGIAELDRVSDVLSRSAHSVKKSLATERDFASDASHQLRTPLTALLMRLEEIGATDDLDVVREEAGVAISQVERLTTVVDGLLVRARSAEQTRPSISLDTVLASLQRDWQPAFASARRSILVEGERGLGVRAAPMPLQQIFSTLLENSLNYGRGTVVVNVRRAGPSVVVEVTDEGEGVDPALAPHIFERSVTSGGTGLGLALARDLAEAQGGRLELIQARPPVFAAFLSGDA